MGLVNVIFQASFHVNQYDIKVLCVVVEFRFQSADLERCLFNALLYLVYAAWCRKKTNHPIDYCVEALSNIYGNIKIETSFMS